MITTEHAAEPQAPDERPDLAAVRTELGEQRRFRVEQLALLESPGAGLPDGAGQPSDVDPLSEVTVALRAAARFALADIDAALARLGDGTYGRCDSCHVAIPAEQLRAVPSMRSCLRCQRPGGAWTRHRDAGDPPRPGRRRDTTGPDLLPRRPRTHAADTGRDTGRRAGPSPSRRP